MSWKERGTNILNNWKNINTLIFDIPNIVFLWVIFQTTNHFLLFTQQVFFINHQKILFFISANYIHEFQFYAQFFIIYLICLIFPTVDVLLLYLTYQFPTMSSTNLIIFLAIIHVSFFLYIYQIPTKIFIIFEPVIFSCVFLQLHILHFPLKITI